MACLIMRDESRHFCEFVTRETIIKTKVRDSGVRGHRKWRNVLCSPHLPMCGHSNTRSLIRRISINGSLQPPYLRLIDRWNISRIANSLDFWSTILQHKLSLCLTALLNLNLYSNYNIYGFSQTLEKSQHLFPLWLKLQNKIFHSQKMSSIA